MGTAGSSGATSPRAPTSSRWSGRSTSQGRNSRSSSGGASKCPAAERRAPIWAATWAASRSTAACPWLRPGKYAVEVQFYTKEGDRQVTLPPIDAAQDLERDLAVPALRATGE